MPVRSGDKEKDKAIICPCIYHEDEIAKDGHCHCQLYYRKDTAETKTEDKNDLRTRHLLRDLEYRETNHTGSPHAHAAKTGTICLDARQAVGCNTRGGGRGCGTGDRDRRMHRLLRDEEACHILPNAPIATSSRPNSGSRRTVWPMCSTMRSRKSSGLSWTTGVTKNDKPRYKCLEIEGSTSRLMAKARHGHVNMKMINGSLKKM